MFLILLYHEKSILKIRKIVKCTVIHGPYFHQSYRTTWCYMHLWNYEMCAVYTYSVKYCSNIETSAPFQIVLDIDTIEMLSLQFGEKGGGINVVRWKLKGGRGGGTSINPIHCLPSRSCGCRATTAYSHSAVWSPATHAVYR